MSQTPINSINNTMGTPLYNYPEPTAVTTQQGQTVSVNSPYTCPIYQYPTSSVYEPSKQASGVNIMIFNPSGYSNGNGGCVPYYPVMQPQIINNIPQQPAPVVNNNVNADTPIANTPIQQQGDNASPTGKTKRITHITDEYIKNLETYLRDPSAKTREIGITQLIKLLEEEDPSRYDNPALNALLNIALQDAEPANRVYAMVPITTGAIHGDANTKKILEGLAASTKLNGQEADMAKEALLLVSRDTQEIPDYSVPKSK